MNLYFRKINHTEFYHTEFLTRETFWNLYNPGCTEHLLLHNLRNCDAYIEDLDLVVLDDDKVIGHIISTRAKVVNNDNFKYEVLYVGPFSIDYQYQNKGIGTQLLNYAVQEAQKMKFNGMILYGNPDYYHRFGFKNTQEYKITTKDGLNFEPFMALELQKDGFQNVEGKFFEDKATQIDENQLNKFEAQFPRKEKGEPKFKM